MEKNINLFIKDESPVITRLIELSNKRNIYTINASLEGVKRGCSYINGNDLVIILDTKQYQSEKGFEQFFALNLVHLASLFNFQKMQKILCKKEAFSHNKNKDRYSELLIKLIKSGFSERGMTHGKASKRGNRILSAGCRH